MAKGGYNGGSTIIGFGRQWSFDPDFPATQLVAAPTKSTLRRAKMADQSNNLSIRKSPSGTVPSETIRLHSRVRTLDTKAILQGLGIALPKMPRKRGPILKQLVAEGILLRTGGINPHHPRVAAWLKSKGKRIA